jgi:hypothetical protein
MRPIKPLLLALFVSSVSGGSMALADEPTPAPPPSPGAGSDGSNAPVLTPPPVEPPSTEPPPAATKDDEFRDRIRELEGRVDEVEKQSALQRLQWSGDYRTTLGSYWYHGASPDSNPYARPTIIDLRNQEQWLHRVRLMIKGEPNKSFRFRGRFSVFKRFGTNTTTPSPQDFSQGRVPSDTTLRMDRFWLDWFITPKLALSFGRISYSDGSPAELRENLDKPDATWGQNMVDGEYETVDLTAQITKGFLVRGFYASWAFPHNDDLFSSNLFLNDGTKNLRIVGGNVDFTIPEANVFAQLGAYYVPEFRPFAIPLPSPSFYQNPAANPSNAPPPLDGSLVFPSSMPASLGSYGNLSMLLMSRDLYGLDLFVGGSLGFLNPNDKAISYRGFAYDAMGQPILDAQGLPAESPLLTLAGSDQGYFTYDAQGTPTWHAAPASHLTQSLYTGMRWTLPVGGVHAPKVGLEYNYGSRYAISFAQTTDLLTNKLAVRGSAWEAYYIQQINERAFLRIDWQFIDAKYTSGSPGNIAGATGFFGIPDSPLAPGFAHGGTSPPVDPGGQHLHALTVTLHANF